VLVGLYSPIAGISSYLPLLKPAPLVASAFTRLVNDVVHHTKVL